MTSVSKSSRDQCAAARELEHRTDSKMCNRRKAPLSSLLLLSAFLNLFTHCLCCLFLQRECQAMPCGASKGEEKKNRQKWKLASQRKAQKRPASAINKTINTAQTSQGETSRHERIFARDDSRELGKPAKLDQRYLGVYFYLRLSTRQVETPRSCL